MCVLCDCFAPVLMLQLLALDPFIAVEGVEVSPSQVDARVGTNVTLSCSTPIKRWVDWTFRPAGPESEHALTYRGEAVNGFRNKGLLSNDADEQYALTILNVQLNDSGWYGCTENNGFGDTAYAEVRVHETMLPADDSRSVTSSDIATHPAESSVMPNIDVHNSSSVIILVVLLVVPVSFAVIALIAWIKRESIIQSFKALMGMKTERYEDDNKRNMKIQPLMTNSKQAQPITVDTNMAYPDGSCNA